VSLSVSLHPQRLLPALVLKFRPSGRRAGQGRWRPTGKGEVEVDPARNGADRRRCRPGRQIWRRTSAADSRTPAARGVEDRACRGRGEGEGRPTRSGREAPFISAGSWIPIRIRGFIFIVEAPATKEKVKSPCLSIWM